MCKFLPIKLAGDDYESAAVESCCIMRKHKCATQRRCREKLMPGPQNLTNAMKTAMGEKHYNSF